MIEQKGVWVNETVKISTGSVCFGLDRGRPGRLWECGKARSTRTALGLMEDKSPTLPSARSKPQKPRKPPNEADSLSAHQTCSVSYIYMGDEIALHLIRSASNRVSSRHFHNGRTEVYLRVVDHTGRCWLLCWDYQQSDDRTIHCAQGLKKQQ